MKVRELVALLEEENQELEVEIYMNGITGNQNITVEECDNELSDIPNTKVITIFVDEHAQ